MDPWLDACPIGVAITSAGGANTREYVAVNDAFARMLGRPGSYFTGRPVHEVVPEADPGGPHAGTVQVDAVFRHRHADGRWRPLRVRSSPIGDDSRWISYATEAAGPRVAEVADRDPVTGLGTARALRDALGERGSEATGVMVVGIDLFSEINATHGMAAGDRLLHALGQLLSDRFRWPSETARLGGDVFGVLVVGEPLEEAAHAIVAAVRAVPFEVLSERLAVTVSVGGCHVPSDVDALGAAGLALTEAKRQGRDRSVVAGGDSAPARAVGAWRRWTDHVRHALVEDGLRLVEQPIVRLADGARVSGEVLVRLALPDGEIVAPGTFLPAAERSGQIRAVDRWVVAAALERMRRAPAAHLHVNLSASTLSDGAAVEDLLDRVEAAQLAPGRLTFEITETAAMTQISQAVAFSQRLAALGCRLAIDDFGMGWASFQYLREIPVDVIKIDRSFVTQLGRRTRDQTIVRAIVGIAQDYGVQTVAEGVEDDATADLLRTMHIDLAQGYRFGRPA